MNTVEAIYSVIYYYIGDFNAGVWSIVQCWIGYQKPKTNIQGDQLNMAVVACTKLRSCTLLYSLYNTGPVTFYKVPEQRGHV